MLRLSSTTVGPVSVAVGANAGVCGDCLVEAYNAGNGTMNLSAAATDPATGKSASWLQASVGGAQACRTVNQPSCIPITITLNTAGLSAGISTAIVTLSDPNTADAPQTITVTVQVGGGVPNSVTQYVAPGGSADFPITTNSNLRATAITQDKNNWLSLQIAQTGQGSFTFVYPFTIHLAPQLANVAGAYTGSLALSGSSFAGDNKTVAVTMNVTTQPIAQTATQVLNVRLAQGAPQYVTAVVVTNSGQGTLAVQNVTASSTGGSWLSASKSGNVAVVTMNPSSLAPGAYTGSLSITSNAVNALPSIPVNLQVVANGPPYIPYQQVVDGATFTPGDAVSPGDVVTVFGEQLSYAAPSLGGAPPLPNTLNTTQVLINGQAAPLFYNSYNQINFQMPVNVPTGAALVNVVRDGQTSNSVSIGIVNRVPRILLFGTSGFGAIVNNDGCRGQSPCLLGGSLPFTSDQSLPGYPAYPARIGDTLTIYAIGLGATSPSVGTGQPAPSAEPFARLATTPSVRFGNNPFSPQATPSFAALSPGFAGLYQVNVQIPQGTPSGLLALSVIFPDSSSNQVLIAVQ